MHIQQIDEAGPERSYVVVFDEGEEVVAGLARLAERERLSGARLSAIGAFRRVTLAFFDLESREYEPIEVDEQVEVASLLGNLTLSGDEHRVHAHAVVGRRDGTALAGHLLAGTVRPTLEVFVIEAPAHLRRHHDAKTGLPLLQLVP